MNTILNSVLLCLTMASGLTATAQTNKQVTQLNGPEATVRSLYREVQNRAPSGLLDDANMRIFAHYLSKSLRREIDLAKACEKDWVRQNRGQMVKAPFAWSEFGLFSGANERTSPGEFHIESIRKTENGSFQVVVDFAYHPGDGSGSWRVTDHVIKEDGRFVVDDVLFPKEGPEDGSTLTGRLSEGCEGRRWVGLR